MTKITFFNYRGCKDYIRKYHCMIRYLFDRYAIHVYNMFDGEQPAWKRIVESEFVEYVLFMWVLDEYDEKKMFWTEKLLGEKMFDPSTDEFNIVYRLFENIIQRRIALNENGKHINEIRTAGSAYEI